MNKVSVRLENIGKKYSVSHQKPSLIGNILRRQKIEKFWALKNINLEIKNGESIGIIGPNGAGKTTLLRIISGITEPTKGNIKTRGKIVSLMNLEAGFHPELTGEENIYVNGLLNGVTKGEIIKKFKDIVDFADIGKFINAPFYTYSDGMKFRLAFSLAIASECEILIMDEIFLSGDYEFQEKTFNAIRKIQDKKNLTTIITSHIAALVLSFSKRYYELDKGKISGISKNKMLGYYNKQNEQWEKRTRLTSK